MYEDMSCWVHGHSNDADASFSHEGRCTEVPDVCMYRRLRYMSALERHCVSAAFPVRKLRVLVLIGRWAKVCQNILDPALGAGSGAKPEKQISCDFICFRASNVTAIHTATKTVGLSKFLFALVWYVSLECKGARRTSLLLAAGNCLVSSRMAQKKCPTRPCQEMPSKCFRPGMLGLPACALHASGIGTMGARNHLPDTVCHLEVVQDKSDAQHPWPFEHKTKHVINQAHRPDSI